MQRRAGLIPFLLVQETLYLAERTFFLPSLNLGFDLGVCETVSERTRCV